MAIENQSSILSVAASASYLTQRNELKDTVIHTITNSEKKLTLRGSWKFDDFHLNPDDLTTYSDIDLIAAKPLYFERERLICSLEQALAPRLKIKVSIHHEDHLTHIALADSKIKNIYEYLIYYHNAAPSAHSAISYFKAKIMMLLMKTVEHNQRFAEIKDELPTASMQNLYLIKIGLANQIDLAALEETILVKADATARSFFQNCIVRKPSSDYFDSIQQQFLACRSISNWLKLYISGKLKKHAI